MFKIQTGTKLPTRGRLMRLPLADLQVSREGSTYFIDVRHAELKPGTVSSRIAAYNKRNKGTKFITEQVVGRGHIGKCTRVFRVK